MQQLLIERCVPGNDIYQWMLYDEISAKNEEQDNQFLLKELLNVKTQEDLLIFLNSLEPDNPNILL